MRVDSRDKLIEKLRALVAKQAFQLEQQALRIRHIIIKRSAGLDPIST